MTELQWTSDLISPKNVAGTALIGKACDILEIIGNAPGAVDQTVLADRTNIPRATLYRILAALVSRGLVRTDSLSQNYTLGFKFLELAQNAWSSSDLASIASVELRRLRDLTGETSYLAVQEGSHVLALGRFESAHGRRSNAKLGALKPMHCTSQGKSILAHLPSTSLDHILSDGLQAFTANTITDADHLKEHLAIVRARGYAMDDEEIVLGTRCVGAAILDPDGKPIAAISVAGPTFRMGLERAEQLGKELAEVAKRISIQLEPSLKISSKHSDNYCVWSAAPAFIGASPRWHSATSSMVWADQLAPAIRTAAGSQDLLSLHTLSQSISTFCLTTNGFVIASGSDLILGNESRLGDRIFGSPILIVRALRTAPDGALWAAAYDAETNMSRVGPWSRCEGFRHVFEMPGDVSDIAFAGDIGLFVAQASRQSVYLFDPDTGRKRKFADIPKVAGSPTAIAIDEQFNPWVALSDGWSVVKLNDMGDIERTVALPVPNPTGIAFGGQSMSELFITSIRSGLSRDSLINAPLSGHLISINVGERGLIETPASI